LEVQFVNGPLFAGQAYTVLGRIVAINHSPKTEVIWQDLSLSANGRTVATVRIQSRFMKSSSDLWNS
jgi:hypothetical protein